jgi:RNA polymerase sigma-70 factor (ECF subfamily)
MARIAAGEREALRQLYDATSAKLFGVCLRILSDREESEDVLQDVYVTIWRRADRFDSARASVMTWVSTIARNRAIDRSNRLHHCLGELDDRTEQVIRTAFFEGVTYEALARRMDAPLGTVKSWIRRGLAKLKGCLQS